MKVLLLLVLKLLLTLLKLPFVPIMTRPKNKWIEQRKELITHLDNDNVEVARTVAQEMDFNYMIRVSYESKLLFLNLWRKVCDFSRPQYLIGAILLLGYPMWATALWIIEHFFLLLWTSVVAWILWVAYKKFKDHPKVAPIIKKVVDKYRVYEVQFSVWILACVDEEKELQEYEKENPPATPIRDFIRKAGNTAMAKIDEKMRSERNESRNG